MLIVADNLNAHAGALLRRDAGRDEALPGDGHARSNNGSSGCSCSSRGPAGDELLQVLERANDRFSEIERRSLYARAFGIPGGDAVQGAPNREFKDLWLRFVSAVSTLRAADRRWTACCARSVPWRVSQEQVRKSGRDLAANLSLHGYGIAYFAATELQHRSRKSSTLLSDPEIKNAYGARDMFQVIEQVILYELGGARNSVRYRASRPVPARSSSAGWPIARTASPGSATGDVIGSTRSANPLPRRPATKPTTNPSDPDLVNAVRAMARGQRHARTATIEE